MLPPANQGTRLYVPSYLETQQNNGRTMYRSQEEQDEMDRKEAERQAVNKKQLEETAVRLRKEAVQRKSTDTIVVEGPKVFQPETLREKYNVAELIPCPNGCGYRITPGSASHRMDEVSGA